MWRNFFYRPWLVFKPQKFLKQSNILFSFLLGVFVFLSFNKFLYWSDIYKPWIARRTRHGFPFAKWRRQWKARKPIRFLSLVKTFVCGLWLVIRYFSLVRKIIQPIRLRVLCNASFLFNNSFCSKSQYIYNKYRFQMRGFNALWFKISVSTLTTKILAKEVRCRTVTM